jgi:hypothetical protein
MVLQGKRHENGLVPNPDSTVGSPVLPNRNFAANLESLVVSDTLCAHKKVYNSSDIQWDEFYKWVAMLNCCSCGPSVHMLEIRWLWTVEPSVIYIWREFGILTSSVSWKMGLVNFIFDPLFKLWCLEGSVCFAIRVKWSRKKSCFFALNCTVFVRFLYSENYKCSTNALSHKHLIAIMVSSDLILFIVLFDIIPSFWTPMVYLCMFLHM